MIFVFEVDSRLIDSQIYCIKHPMYYVDTVDSVIRPVDKIDIDGIYLGARIIES